MHSNNSFLFGVAVFCVIYGICLSQKSRNGIPVTRFTCQGRPSGYYADIETGCQVYHMCDGLGRQFSYTCPNTTLFQQRMLICDHWYMVNCSSSERDYSANLLIGQRDKPFVSDEEMQFRTPRPDILSVPPNNNYYDGLKEAESKFPAHPDNHIVGIGDTISRDNNNGLDSAKQQYRPPTSWSTGTASQNNYNFVQSHDRNTGNSNNGHDNDRFSSNTGRPDDNLTGAASHDTRPTYEPTPTEDTARVTPPDQHLTPPGQPTTDASDEFILDVRMDDREDPVYNFIKRFDPNSPDSRKTAMSASEIASLNSQLPSGHDVSNEDERTPRRNKNGDNNLNSLRNTDKETTETTRFNSVNEKPTIFDINNGNNFENNFENGIKVPEKVLQPPKYDQSEQPSTTMGPIVYYEWKWAVPAIDLEPPKQSNITKNNSRITSEAQVKNPFSNVIRTTQKPVKVIQPNTEYNTSSYFVPDYVFPLDKEHPGYEHDNAETSFQVKVARPGRSSYGENPACPHCHPAYLKPGTCEPCIVKR